MFKNIKKNLKNIFKNIKKNIKYQKMPKQFGWLVGFF